MFRALGLLGTAFATEHVRLSANMHIFNGTKVSGAKFAAGCDASGL